MKIRQTIAALAIALATLSVNSAYASDIVYSVDQIIGPGSVTGTITTDGTIGILSASDIVGFNLTLNDGSNTANLSSGTVINNRDACCSGGVPNSVDLTASLTNLMFNYSGSDSGYFEIGNSSGAICYTNTSNCWGPTGVGLYSVDGDGRSVYIAQSGNQIIATAVPVPEPSSWALMLLGAGLLGGALRVARRNRARALLAA